MTDIRNFVAELRRRRVFRAIAAYAVVGWVVVQAAAIVVPELMLPEWIPRAVIVLVVLGFPLVAVLAWAYDITPAGAVGTESGEGPGTGDRATTEAERSASDGPRADAREARTAADPGPRRSSAVRGGLWVLAAALVVAAGGTAAWLVARPGTEPLPRGDELRTRLHALAAAGEYDAAYALAVRAEDAGETVPDSTWSEVADRLTIVTTPPGARVRAVRFRADRAGAIEPDAWEVLGTTPLRGHPVARGDYRLRLELEDHAPVDRITSSAFAREELGSAEVHLTVELPARAEVPPDMVVVPGGRYAVASRDLQGLSATLEDFFLDRFEVSNARFSEFVDAGGYATLDYWGDLVDALGGDAASMRRRLVDRTGLPAPRGWSGQRYPAGGERHPVTGVSWYEAAAYCRFRGLRLPTLFEWEKAARDGQIVRGEGVFMPWGYLRAGTAGAGRANFKGNGPEPVDSYPFGMSQYGAFGMAGNVKEWLVNPSEEGRTVTGGSWADPVYLFTEVGSVDPSSASDVLGFRCARLREPRAAGAGDQGAHALRVLVEPTRYTPVDDVTFQALLTHYAYDPGPLNARVTETLDAPGWRRERIEYDGPGGSRVVAYLHLPRVGRPPFQTLVMVPGSDAFWGTSPAAYSEWLLEPFVRTGRALFTVVMEGMTEREFGPDYEWPAPHTVRFRDQMVRHATELRIGLDYLETREDIDAGAIGYVGLSWGAGSRLLFAALDERFQSVTLVGGGIDERVQPTLPEASNINFAPRITAPTLLLNGREDEEHPWRTRALPLWNLLSEPKELILVEGAGHVPPPEARVPALREWFDRTLGPVPD